MKPERQRIKIGELNSVSICGKCLNEIDPGVCHCGDLILSHGVGSGHNPVPNGCTCGYYDQSKVARNTAPDYLGSRDAIMQVIIDLMVGEQEKEKRFLRELGEIWTDRESDDSILIFEIEMALIISDAADLSKALLKTFDLWEEE